MLKLQNITKYIQLFLVSNKNNEDIFYWPNKSEVLKNSYLEILAIKSQYKTQNVFYKILKHDSNICYIQRKGYLYIIMASNTLQTQTLEAILEKSYLLFEEYYGDMALDIYGDFNDIFKGFNDFFEKILQTVSEDIFIINPFCRICNKRIEIQIRKSFIENAKNFPTSLVFIHKGHGLLVYVDRQFKARGEEIVNISG